VSYTATYTGQVKFGERVEISGLLERSSSGDQRVMVGSSREAEGQYIKVIADHG
jgi:predicted nucleotidyltransferase